jgi:photosystem II stability/assembly factor-like uncharacterized protein
MKKVVLILMFFTVASNAQWVQQISGTTQPLFSVCFVNDQTGFAAGNSLIKTTNGGTNWNAQFGGIDNLYTVYFSSINTGWVAGGLGQIYKTTNTGLNWLNISLSTSNIFRSAYFVNDQTGWLAGNQISKTTNGGANWTQQNFGIALFNSVHFADINTGWITGDMGQVYRTTNSGLNWVQQQSNTGTNLNSIYFISSTTGFMAGTDSRVYKTTNGGNNWSVLYNQGLCGLNAIRFINESTGWVCGCEGSINKTTNGGLNWTQQSLASTTYLYSMSFVSALTGWAVGAGGRILKTTTGGITGIQPNSNEIPLQFSLSQNYPNPFNPTTKIRFDISGSSATQTLLSVYDMLGREVATLVNEKLKPGTYEVDWNASDYPSGVYFYKLISGKFSQTKKMILMK